MASDDYTLTCYGEPFATCVDLDEAKDKLSGHIWDCPRGAMPQAKPIEWHEIDSVHPVTGEEIGKAWMSAWQGEWLDHAIRLRDR